MRGGIETIARQQPLGEPSSKDHENDIAVAQDVDTAIAGDRAEREIVRGCQEDV